MNTTRVIVQFIITSLLGYLLLLGILAGTLPLTIAATGFTVLWLINRRNPAL